MVFLIIFMFVVPILIFNSYILRDFFVMFSNNLHIRFDGSLAEGGAYGMKLGGPDGAFPPYGDGFGLHSV